jgi:hypothetical protein
MIEKSGCGRKKTVQKKRAAEERRKWKKGINIKFGEEDGLV